MATRHVMLGLAVLTLCTAVEQPAAALEIVAKGSYTDQRGKGGGTWSGRFMVDGASVTGALDLDGAERLQAAPISGFLNKGAMDLSVTDAAGKTNAFGAHLTDTGMEGTFQLGDLAGTWTGTWSVAPGEPLAFAPLEPPAPPREPRTEVPAAWTDAYDVCTALDDPDIAPFLSPARAAAMHRECDGWAEASNSPVRRVAWRLGEALRPMWRWVGDRLITARAAWAAVSNVRVNNSSLEAYPNITQGSPSIAVNRNQITTLLSAFEDFTFGATRRIAYSVSTNQGSTWNAQQAFVPPVPPDSIDGEPVTASESGPDGAIYVAYLGTKTGQPGGVIHASCTRNSGDQNVQWATSTLASEPFPPPNLIRDKPNIAVGANKLYVCYTEMSAGSSTIRLASTSGETPPCPSGGGLLGFASNQDVLEGEYNPDGPATNCSVAVGPNGDLYVGWWKVTDQKMFVRRSTTGGATWSAAVALTTNDYAKASSNQCSGTIHIPILLPGSVYSEPRLQLAADPLVPGRLYASWGHFGAAFSSEVYFTRSDNHGSNWTFPPNILNSTTTNDQFLPALVAFNFLPASPDITEIDALWHDRRLDASNTSYDLYRRASYDGGVTWQTEERVSSQTLPLPQLNPHFDPQAHAAGRDCVLTTRAGLTDNNPTGAFSYPEWTDTRIVSQPQPDPDIVIAVPASGGC